MEKSEEITLLRVKSAVKTSKNLSLKIISLLFLKNMVNINATSYTPDIYEPNPIQVREKTKTIAIDSKI